MKLCCGKPPTLRVRPRTVQGAVIPYVRLECPVCGSMGPLSITEEEALRSFELEDLLPAQKCACGIPQCKLEFPLAYQYRLGRELGHGKRL